MAPFGKLYTYEVCYVQLQTASLFSNHLSELTSNHAQGNPRSTAIRAVAKANNIDLEIVDTKIGKDISPEYLKINKLGKVPTFVGADGYVLHECIAIAIYSTWPLAH